jgi:hypothetical protein
MEPSPCTSPRRELSKDTKNMIWRSQLHGSHNYKTKQNKLPSFIDRWQGHSVTHPLFAYIYVRTSRDDGGNDSMFLGVNFCHLVTKRKSSTSHFNECFRKKKVSKSRDIRKKFIKQLDNRSPKYSRILNFFLLGSMTCHQIWLIPLVDDLKKTLVNSHQHHLLLCLSCW